MRYPLPLTAAASVSVLLIAVLLITLFCSALFGLEIAELFVALFVGSMGALITWLVCFIRDVNVNLTLQAFSLDFPAEWNRVAGRDHDDAPQEPARV